MRTLARTIRRAFPLVALFACAACAPHVDVSRQASELLAVDREWSQGAARGQPADSLIAYWTDDARVSMAGQPLYTGKAAIGEMVRQSVAVPGFKLTWIPDSAVVAASGDLGYTFGTNSVTFPDSAGKLTTAAGRYITVWRKNAQGRWQCVMDYSTPA